MSEPIGPRSLYHGPSFDFAEEEIIRLGGCVFAPPDASGTFSETDYDFVVELSKRLTDAHFEAAVEAAGLRDTAPVQTLVRRAATEGGSAEYLRTRLRGSVEFDIGQCIGGVLTVVGGIGVCSLAADAEAASLGAATAGAIIAVVAGGAMILQGASIAQEAC